MGNFYAFERDGPRDYQRAIAFFRQSAALRNTNGQVNLGYLYQNGFGVDKNLIVALALYKISNETKYIEFMEKIMTHKQIEEADLLKMDMDKPNNILEALDRFIAR